MMKNLLLIIFISISSLVFGEDIKAAKTKEVTITFHGIQEAKGNIEYSLVSEKDRDSFPHPGKKENGSFGGKLQVENKDKVTVKVTLPVNQKFAISAYHDVDGNGEFKLVMYVIPKEPYGFSVIKDPPLGEPDFAECSFDPSKVSMVDVFLK